MGLLHRHASRQQPALASRFHHSATPPPALAARRRRRRLRAPTELIVRLEFVPEARLGLGGHASRFKQGPDLGLLLPEERLEALPVGPLVENHHPAAVV